MSEKTLRALTVAFGISLAGILGCLAMTIVTAVRQHQAEKNPTITIPVPAIGS